MKRFLLWPGAVAVAAVLFSFAWSGLPIGQVDEPEPAVVKSPVGTYKGIVSDAMREEIAAHLGTVPDDMRQSIQEEIDRMFASIEALRFQLKSDNTFLFDAGSEGSVEGIWSQDGEVITFTATRISDGDDEWREVTEEEEAPRKITWDEEEQTLRLGPAGQELILKKIIYEVTGSYIVDLDSMLEEARRRIEAEYSGQTPEERQQAEAEMAMTEGLFGMVKSWELDIKDDRSFTLTIYEPEMLEGTWVLDGDQLTLTPTRFSNGEEWEPAEGVFTEPVTATWKSDNGTIHLPFDDESEEAIIFKKSEKPESSN